MAKVTVRLLHDDGVSEADRRQAKRALETATSSLPDGYLGVGESLRYEGPSLNVLDRQRLADTVDQWLRERFEPGACDDTVFVHLVDASPLEYLTDVPGAKNFQRPLGAGYSDRVVGIEGEHGYSHGLAVANTYVSAFVALAPVPYDGSDAVGVTAVHEAGHALMAGVEGSEHDLGVERYYDTERHRAEVTPMTYWYDEQLATWARNPVAVPPSCPVDPEDLVRGTEEFAEDARTAIVEHVDYHFG
ncbi:hypothetical protein [Halospeciosus flavus]|uniref:Uncharacterized protein n=1 Tax=Halospeciosus flavus TaxID=3032283 RepID=A0ABD5Z9I3_9EURY|nr:hypothetical protein [Halospeciosus flavus]